MFTGIVTHLGEVDNISHPDDWQLCVKVIQRLNSTNISSFEDLLIGSSISCSGICLTLKKRQKNVLFSFGGRN